jgi:hypothetical protein
MSIACVKKPRRVVNVVNKCEFFMRGFYSRPNAIARFTRLNAGIGQAQPNYHLRGIKMPRDKTARILAQNLQIDPFVKRIFIIIALLMVWYRHSHPQTIPPSRPIHPLPMLSLVPEQAPDAKGFCWDITMP